MFTIFITIVALLYIFFDVNYFIRIVFTIVLGRLFEKKKNVLDATTVYGICTTNDLDIMFKHMNNARYVRDLDFARFHYYDRTGLYDEIMKNKAHALQTASCIRYRRTIPFLQPYKITTKVVYWEEKTLYIEQQFITLSDGFIRAVVLSKQTTIGLDVPAVMAKLSKKSISYRPTPPAEFNDWVESMNKSSNRLKKSQ